MTKLAVFSFLRNLAFFDFEVKKTKQRKSPASKTCQPL